MLPITENVSGDRETLQTDIWTDGRTERQTDRETDRQTDGQRDRERDRQTLSTVVDMRLAVSRLIQTDGPANLQSRHEIIGVSRTIIN